MLNLIALNLHNYVRGNQTNQNNQSGSQADMNVNNYGCQSFGEEDEFGGQSEGEEEDTEQEAGQHSN